MARHGFVFGFGQSASGCAKAGEREHQNQRRRG
jgi:hypothetical protein